MKNWLNFLKFGQNLIKKQAKFENFTKIGQFFQMWPKFDKNQGLNLTKIGQFFKIWPKFDKNQGPNLII